MRLYNCNYDVCLLRGLSALSGEQFLPLKQHQHMYMCAYYNYQADNYQVIFPAIQHTSTTIVHLWHLILFWQHPTDIHVHTNIKAKTIIKTQKCKHYTLVDSNHTYSVDQINSQRLYQLCHLR